MYKTMLEARFKVIPNITINEIERDFRLSFRHKLSVSLRGFCFKTFVLLGACLTGNIVLNR